MMAIPVQIFRSTSLFSNDGGRHGHSLRGERAHNLRIISLPPSSTAEMVRNPPRRILKPISKRKGNNPFQI